MIDILVSHIAGSPICHQQPTGKTLISLLLPTRQRPRQLSRLVDSVNETRYGEVELVTYIDLDDDSYDDLDLDIPWIKVRGPRTHNGLVNLSLMWNLCYEQSSGEIVMHCGDDIVMRTQGWDDVVYQTFNSYPDNLLFAYGDDLYQPHTFGTHGFIHRDWVTTVGFLFPPRFSSDYNDTVLNVLAQQVDRHVFIPIVTEHMHFICGKAEIDQNTRERLERHQKDRPDVIFESDEVQEMIREAADRLRAAMKTEVGH